MSRQDFIRIAETILNPTPDDGCHGPAQRERIATAFAAKLAPTNPRFNRTLFIQAAMGLCPLNARKPR